MSSSDEALLAGLAAGDRDASAAFVRRFQRRAYGLARTIVSSPSAIADWRSSSSGASTSGRRIEPRFGARGAELVERSARRIPLASFRLADGAWGGSIPVDLGDLAAVHLVAADGRSALVAEL